MKSFKNKKIASEILNSLKKVIGKKKCSLHEPSFNNDEELLNHLHITESYFSQDFNNDAYIGNPYPNSNNTDTIPLDLTSDWTKVFIDQYDFNTRPSDIEINNEDQIYVLGIKNGDLYDQSTVGDSNAFVSKHNSFGDTLWTRIIGSSQFDEGTALDISGMNKANPKSLINAINKAEELINKKIS